MENSVKVTLLPVDESVNDKNRVLVREYCKSGFGFGSDSLIATSKGWHIQNVSSEIVERFLLSFRVHTDFIDQRNAHAKYLATISERYPECDVLFDFFE